MPELPSCRDLRAGKIHVTTRYLKPNCGGKVLRGMLPAQVYNFETKSSMSLTVEFKEHEALTLLNLTGASVRMLGNRLPADFFEYVDFIS